MTANQRGIVLMVLGMGGFALEDMFIKLMAARLPPGEILLALGLGGFVLFGAIAARRGLWVFSRGFLHRAVLGRNLGEMLGTFGYVLAVALSPLTTTTAIFQATPLAVTMGAALFLGEHVGWRRWTAIAVGFAGVLMIVRPGSEAFVPASMFALLAVVGLSGRDLFTRRIPRSIDSMLLVAWGFGVVGLVGLAEVVVLGGAVRPDGQEVAWFAGGLASGAAGYWWLTQSTRVGELSAIMPFRYSRLLFAMVIGITVFAETPDAWTICGSALIVASGIYSLLRERARARAARESLSPASAPR
ncbi:DMT family transporter [Rubellimicrobium mesophilum]|nr:DMT family transporter [Rubellimicrobium mesophilum]